MNGFSALVRSARGGREAPGAAPGIVYTIASSSLPALPALGLSKGPRRMSGEVLAYALAAHWVYGLTLDASTRVVSRD